VLVLAIEDLEWQVVGNWNGMNCAKYGFLRLGGTGVASGLLPSTLSIYLHRRGHCRSRLVL